MWLFSILCKVSLSLHSVFIIRECENYDQIWWFLYGTFLVQCAEEMFPEMEMCMQGVKSGAISETIYEGESNKNLSCDVASQGLHRPNGNWS